MTNYLRKVRFCLEILSLILHLNILKRIMKFIESRNNPEVKEVYSLRISANRKKQLLFIAEGQRTCTTLIESKIKLKQLYVTEQHRHTISQLIDDNKLTIVTEPVMQKISQAKTPSGILGVFYIPSTPAPERISFGMILAQVSDPGNMGTLIRSCAAMNAQSVVIIEGVDPWSFKVVQSTAGFIGHINIFEWDWEQTKKLAQQYNLKLYALVVAHGKDIKTLKKEKALLVVGSEAHGIPSQWIKDCHDSITLEMPGNIESLNAAVAGSIALYLISSK